MNRHLISLLLLLVPMLAQATDYSTYYRNLPVAMPMAVAPVIPDNTVTITETGGVGDGETMNTDAFRKAVSRLEKLGGGHLVVPAGVWLTGAITLKDNIDLHLERNAVILMSPMKRDHFKVEDGKVTAKTTPAISASKRTNISITGEGTIDGNGQYWRPVKRGKVSDVEWKEYMKLGGTVTADGQLWYPYNLKNQPNITSSMEAEERLRQNLIGFTDCKNVLIEGVTIQNSPRFHVVPRRCDNVIISGVTVRCPWNAQNGDGIDITNSRNVLVVGNTVSVGDDGICMKSGVGERGVEGGPCENVNIQDNRVYHAHGGFVIGSDVSGGMKNMYVANNYFSGTDTGLRFKSAIGRGGRTERIFIENIYMTDIKSEAIVFQCDYWDNHVGAKQPGEPKKVDFAPDFQDIHIKNVVCRRAGKAVSAHGQRGMVHDITLTNCKFYDSGGNDIAADCGITISE